MGHHGVGGLWSPPPWCLCLGPGVSLVMFVIGLGGSAASCAGVPCSPRGSSLRLACILCSGPIAAGGCQTFFGAGSPGMAVHCRSGVALCIWYVARGPGRHYWGSMGAWRRVGYFGCRRLFKPTRSTPFAAWSLPVLTFMLGIRLWTGTGWQRQRCRYRGAAPRLGRGSGYGSGQSRHWHYVGRFSAEGVVGWALCWVALGLAD